MKIKRLFIIILLMTIVVFLPVKVLAEEVTCNKLMDVIEEYNDVVEELENTDCEQTTDNDIVKLCNADYTKKSFLLSKIFKYNDQVENCNSTQLKKIINENSDDCKNVYGSTLKNITNTALSIFYIIAPFLMIIFGSLDFSKIVVMSDPKTIKESRTKFFKRLTAFILLYLIPAFLNFVLGLNLSNYSLTGNVYSCKTEYVYHMNRWETTYIPPVTTTNSSNSNSSSVTAEGNWHIDWFQGDSRWGSHAWGGGSGSIAGGGCGSLATSIVCAHYLGDDSENSICYPYKTADEYYNHGLQPNLSSDAITTFFNSWHPEVGVTATKAFGPIDLDKLDSILAAGGSAIADYQSDITYGGRYVWTSGGHYVTIFAGNQKDGYRVADSNGGHDTGYSGISEWAPYGKHVFEKEYIISPWYFYYIEKK